MNTQRASTRPTTIPYEAPIPMALLFASRQEAG
jgi:hypothetical protein